MAVHQSGIFFIRQTRGMGVQCMYSQQITGGVSEADYNITGEYEIRIKEM